MTRKRPSHPGKQPLLSICVHGRDDDYMPDFKYRLWTTIEMHAGQLERLGRLEQVEIVVTDWGSAVPLSEQIVLGQQAQRIVRFIRVPPETVLETQNGVDYYHTSRAVNVGLRRARGKFTFLTNGDQFFSVYGLEQLLRLLDGETSHLLDISRRLLVVPRVQIPWQVVARMPTTQGWTEFIERGEYALDQDSSIYKHCFGVSAGFIMGSREFAALRGLDERHSGWGWNDIDLGLRASQTHGHTWLSIAGIFMFHMAHPPAGRRPSAVGKPNVAVYSSSPAVNGRDWGLGAIRLPECTALEAARKRGRPARQPVWDKERVFSFEGAVSSVERIDDASDLRRLAAEFRHRGRLVPQEDRPFFLLLHCISRKALPLSYLEFGFTDGYFASIVTRSAPGAAVCVAERLEGERSDNPLVTLLHLLEQSGFKGSFRYLNADVSNSPGRIAWMYGPKAAFELIVARALFLESLSDKSFSIVMSLLPRHGALVVRGDVNGSLRKRVEFLRAGAGASASFPSTVGTVRSSFRPPESRTPGGYAFAGPSGSTNTSSKALGTSWMAPKVLTVPRLQT